MNTKLKYRAGRKFFDGKNEVQTVAKLEYAFAIGLNVKEACKLANISRYSYYRYRKNHPDKSSKMDVLKMTNPLISRKFKNDQILNNPNMALNYLVKNKLI